MEFHVIRTAMLSELQLMKGIVEKKSTMPILANFYIKAEDNKLQLKATDLEMGIITECPAQVIEPGEFTVNADKIFEMLGSLKDNQISFSMNEGSMLDLVCGRAQFSVETMAPEDYPSIDEHDFSNAITLGNGFFNSCINKILFSVSKDQHKYALNGGLLRIQDNLFSLVSTDGHRMSVVSKQLNEQISDVNVIIPRKTLTELKKSLQAEGDDETFQIGITDNRIYCKIGVRVLFSRIIDGKFPDYTKAIPSNNDKVFVFDRTELLDIMKRKSVLSSEKSKLVRLTFENGEVTVVLKNAERGESIDKIDIEYDGEPISVGFNVEYVHEFLKSMDVEKIEMNLKDEANQGLFKLADEDVDVEYKHVIMPMRLNN